MLTANNTFNIPTIYITCVSMKFRKNNHYPKCHAGIILMIAITPTDFEKCTGYIIIYDSIFS